MKNVLRAAALLAAFAAAVPDARAGDDGATDWTRAADVAAALRRAVRIEVGDPFHRWRVPVADAEAARRLVRLTADSLRPSEEVRFENQAGVTFVMPDGTSVHAHYSRAGEHMYLRNPDSGELRTFGVAAGVLDEMWKDVERARFRHVETLEQLDALPPDTLAVDVGDPKLLPALARRPGLRALSLMGTLTKDTDLALIPALPKLEYLYLRGMSGYGSNEVTDAGAAHLARLTTLTSLSLGGTEIGDEGLRHLAALRRLERLELDGCANVTAAGLANRLTALPALRFLDLTAAEGVLPEDLAKLSPALMQCRIVLPSGERTTGAALPALMSELRVLRSFTGASAAQGDARGDAREARGDAIHRLVRTPGRWRALWAEHAGDGTAPEVDFAKEVVLAVVTEPRRLFDGMTVKQVIRHREHFVTYHVTGPSGVDPGVRRLYGFFVLPRPRRAIRLFSSHRAGPGPAVVEQQGFFAAAPR